MTANTRLPDRPPECFRPILWSNEFDRLDPAQHRKTIIVQAINYGAFPHWRWLRERYGRDAIRHVLSTIAATEIRPQAQRLASLIFGGDRFNYAPRASH